MPKPISDPALLAKLNAKKPAKVTDPALLEKLHGDNYVHPDDIAAGPVPADTFNPQTDLPLPGNWNGQGYLNGKDANGKPDPGTQTFGTSSSDTLNPIPAVVAGADAAVGTLPMVGPGLQGLRDKANAAANGTTAEQSRAAVESSKEQNPGAVKVGEVVGRAAPYLLASTNPVTAGAMGLEGTIGMRLLMGGLSSETLNVGDRIARGQDPVTALGEGTKDTVAGEPFFLLGSPGAKGAAAKAAPSVAELKAQAKPLYKAAEDSGVVFDKSAVTQAVNDIRSAALKRGLDVTLTPKAVAAFKRIAEFDGRNMTMADAMTLREVLGNAVEKTMGGSDKDHGMAYSMLRQFDDFLESATKPGATVAPTATTRFVPLSEGDKMGLEWSWNRSPGKGMAAVTFDGKVYAAKTHQEAVAAAVAEKGDRVRSELNAHPEQHLGYEVASTATPMVLSGNAAAANTSLRDANKLWSQASKGKMLDDAISVAESSAATHGTSVEKAIRNEFGKIDRSIINGDLAGFSKAEIKAIRDVAYGRGASVLARVLSKLRGGGVPGALSAGSTGAWAGSIATGGNPAGIAGGAALGAGLSGALSAVGALGRRAASRGTTQAAHYASALSREPAIAAKGSVAPLSITSLPATVGRAGVMTLNDWEQRWGQPAN